MLDGAQLQGASLNSAQLQGVSLKSAQLQGASLMFAELQVASLHNAQLQGASLYGAQLQGASFVDACVMRADARQAAWDDTRVVRREKWLVCFLEHRIGDRRIIHLIQKWLKAGVLEDGVVKTSGRGTGQGSEISPLLANIYLHYVFDLWAERWRRQDARNRRAPVS